METSLTSLERMRRAMRFEPVDYPPILPYCDQFAMRQAGYTYREATYDPDKWAEGYARVRDRFDFDCVYDQGSAEGNADLALPRNAYQPEDDMLYFPMPYFISEPEDIERVIPPEDPWANRSMRRLLTTLQKLREHVGPDIPVISTVTAPYRIAGVLRGFDVLAMDLVDRPEWVHELMEKITEGAIRLGQAVVEAGANFVFSVDPTASASFISKRAFVEFAYPYEKRLFDGIRSAGAEGIFFHFCGDTNDRLDMVADDVEFLVQDLGDLKESYDKIGTKVLLGANIPITNVILKGSTEEVERCCIQSILKTEGHLFQSASCHIPWHTPPENFETWVCAAKEYAHYPIDFDYLRKRLEKLPPLGCDEALRGFD